FDPGNTKPAQIYVLQSAIAKRHPLRARAECPRESPGRPPSPRTESRLLTLRPDSRAGADADIGSHTPEPTPFVASHQASLCRYRNSACTRVRRREFSFRTNLHTLNQLVPCPPNLHA